MDIDDSVLRAAELQARQQGKPLASLLEEVLRLTFKAAMPPKPPVASHTCEPLEDNDPFFAALEEIREAGRHPASHRDVQLA